MAETQVRWAKRVGGDIDQDAIDIMAGYAGSKHAGAQGDTEVRVRSGAAQPPFQEPEMSGVRVRHRPQDIVTWSVAYRRLLGLVHAVERS
jgi:hypothetical protein